MTSTRPNMSSALAGELITRTSPAVVEAVAGLLGVAFSAEGVDKDSIPAKFAAECPHVDAYFVELTADVLSVYVISAERMLRYQLTREGQYLSVSIPMRHVSRVAEHNDGGNVTVLIETHADRTATFSETRTVTLEDGTVREISEGSILPSALALVVQAGSPEVVSLTNFARITRLLAS